MRIREMFERWFKREKPEARQERRSAPESESPRPASVERAEAPRPAQAVERERERRDPVEHRDTKGRERRAAESILENESLTSDLDDQAAKHLIDWGLACAKRSAQKTASLPDEEAEQAISDQMRSTRRLMRSVNELVSKRQALDAAGSEQILDKISEQAALIYGDDFKAPDATRRQAILDEVSRKEDPPDKLVENLRRLFDRETPD